MHRTGNTYGGGDDKVREGWVMPYVVKKGSRSIALHLKGMRAG